MRHVFYQNRTTGRAMPDDIATTYNPNWTSFCDGSPPVGLAWKPLQNLVRRIKRLCRDHGIILTRFEPSQKTGWTFPNYLAADRDTPSLWVIIVTDPDCTEDVIFAFGTAIDKTFSKESV